MAPATHLSQIADALTPEFFARITRRTDVYKRYRFNFDDLPNADRYHTRLFEHHIDYAAPTASFQFGTTLPNELMLLTLRELDLNSIANLRSVNREAALLVDSLKEYRTILHLTPNVIRATFVLQIRNGPSCAAIYEKLFTTRCESCNNTGSYLHLLSGERICCPCLLRKMRYLPINRAMAVRRFGLTEGIVATLPSMREQPSGPPESVICPERVDRFQAHQAGVRAHGTEESMNWHVAQDCSQERRSAEFVSRQPSASTAPLQSDLDNLDLSSIHYERSPKDLIFVQGTGFDADIVTQVAVRFPSFDRTTLEKKLTYICTGLGLISPQDRNYHWMREFDLETFVQHLRNDDPLDMSFSATSHRIELLDTFNRMQETRSLP